LLCPPARDGRYEHVAADRQEDALPEVSQSFDVGQPVERVWAFFQDVPQVVTCMPGLELTGQSGDSTYQGKVRIRLGPVTAAFEGEATILETDAAARRARIEAKGIDRKGGSRASAAVVYDLTAMADGTRVTLAGDIKLTGALAQIGRTGIIQDVAAQLTSQFADALRAKLASTPADARAPAGAAMQGPSAAGPLAPPPAPQRKEMSGTGFLLAVLWRRVKRLLGAR
jgi:carbon monoxide dehydrogenase subunit G